MGVFLAQCSHQLISVTKKPGEIVVPRNHQHIFCVTRPTPNIQKFPFFLRILTTLFIYNRRLLPCVCVCPRVLVHAMDRFYIRNIKQDVLVTSRIPSLKIVGITNQTAFMSLSLAVEIVSSCCLVLLVLYWASFFSSHFFSPPRSFPTLDLHLFTSMVGATGCIPTSKIPRVNNLVPHPWLQ